MISHIKVAIVEDSAGICEELVHIIDHAEGFSCVCACRNAESAMQNIPNAMPDVIIMDINLPDGSGIECTAGLKEALPDAQIMMFTISDDADHIVRALEAGASGYLLKDASAVEIVASIREMRDHGAPMSREVARKLIESFHRPRVSATSPEALSPREDEILQLLSEGLLYKEIADRLNIKLDTVCTHVKRIYRKLHVHSRTQAVRKYLRHSGN
ncbi:MAG TPA: response regulator transcription factor [Opitutaceae bacterium]|nr:response regulator transcription factor [Opitutaceae bacterium]